MTTTPSGQHRWRFFRSGGFDQVCIETADDLRHLGELDQKLWAVLACPTAGLEFDERTLQLIDADGDGRIRAPELCAAVRWVCEVLRDPGLLFEPGDSLPLAALDHRHPAGQELLAAAREVLVRVGRAGGDTLTMEDLADPARLFPPNRFNGDGIVPVALAMDDAVRALIEQVIATVGAQTDRSGQPGVSADTLEAFWAAAEQVQAWQDQARHDAAQILAFGDRTPQALNAFDAVQAKVEDYFTRCRLAAFDERAAEALNPVESQYAEIAALALSDARQEVAALPLAKVVPGGALPLVDGINPAWQTAMAALREQVVTPVLGEQTWLTLAQWQQLSAQLTAYRAWLAAKPTTPVADLPAEALADLLQPGTVAALRTLIEQDAQSDTDATAVDGLDKLLRLRRHLVVLLRNFVNLSDFYGGQRQAVFQAGRLYIDQRSCDLCLRVTDMARHAALAPLSGTYLVYCQCVRQGEAPMTIVAAMTGGDTDEMMVPGRNGVFYDRAGRDWNASVVKVVEAPISVRQAFWTPYKRAARMLGEQIQKFAAARDQDVEARSAAGVAQVGAPAQAPVHGTRQQAFDIAKFAGIFAAIGLALGALGTALAAVVSGFLSLPAWQMPLVVLGMVLLISGPSMLLAWFKLRQRNLGPMLDANGWAVNIRARINIPFGAALTGVAALPAGSRRSLHDPYADKASPWPWLMLLAVLLGAVFWVHRQGWL
ncbi:hypothetical protein [Tepidicella baoligensis]|uniref:hypothetical protein n=1 Tax=Tepidicella baoligensis TaxID=2707016 RepID=UPI0015D9E017|nr:hypothetical protein [Tepidicella baoligensis]